MGKPGAFLEHGRHAHDLRPVVERTQDFNELGVNLPEDEQRVQASRCMACGVAFCQFGASFGKARPSGCPLHNLIPEWNDLAWRGQWDEAAARLSLTSPMPSSRAACAGVVRGGVQLRSQRRARDDPRQ